MGKVLFWQQFEARCDCEAAQKYWREQDEAEKAEEERRKAERDEKDRQARIKALIGGSGIKKRFQQRTFDKFICDTPERKRSYDAAKCYADQFEERRYRGEGLYIEGTNGTGKTHLAAAVAMKLLNEGYPVVCKTSIDLLADVKAAFDNKGVSEQEILKAYKQVELLIIDALGKEQCTEWSISTLYDIINDRYEDMKPIIITTNYNADDLIRALTPKGQDNTIARALVSRLRECCRVITMAWQDIRGGQP